MESKQHATKQPMDQQRNQRGNQKTPADKWKWKHSGPNGPKSMGFSKSTSKKEVYSDTSLPQETNNLNLTLHLKELEKEEQTKPIVEVREWHRHIYTTKCKTDS